MSRRGSGVEDVYGKGLSVYPNPASNELFIENAGSINSFEIIDLDGKLRMRVRNTTGDRIRIDISALAGGVYSIRAFEDGQIHTFRFVKD